MKLDHIMYAVQDLREAIDWFDAKLGVAPVIGGRHPGNGTWNALLALGEDCYLELIAPDTEQSLVNNLGAEIRDHGGAGIRTWATAATSLDGLARDMAASDRSFTGPVDMERTTPQGDHLAWQLLFPKDAELGLVLPFIIDWCGSKHPAQTSPKGCWINSITLMTGHSQVLTDWFELMEFSDQRVHLLAADQSGIEASISSPAGELKLTGW